MELKCIGHNSDYNLSLVANLFFTKEDEGEITVASNIEGLTLNAHTTIKFENKTYEASFSAPLAEDDDFINVKRLTNVVCGMSLFLCAKQIRDKILPWGTITGIRPSKPMRQMLAVSNLPSLFDPADSEILNRYDGQSLSPHSGSITRPL